MVWDVERLNEGFYNDLGQTLRREKEIGYDTIGRQEKLKTLIYKLIQNLSDKNRAKKKDRESYLTLERPKLSLHGTTNANAFCHPSPLAPANC